MLKNEDDDCLDSLEEINSLSFHCSTGILHQRLRRYQASACAKESELEAIYKLVDSHVPSLRNKTVVRYEKIIANNLNENSTSPLVALKSNIGIKCSASHLKENIENMLKQVEEMPKEWMIIQLTPQYCPNENLNMETNIYQTNPLHISVFNCGQRQILPILMTVDVPRDSVNGNKIELAQEMILILEKSKESLTSTYGKKTFRNQKDKMAYLKKREAVEDRLKHIIKDIQDMWLGEWRSLFIGKYIDDDLDQKVRQEIRSFLKNEVPDFEPSEKIVELLSYIMKGASYLKLTELKKAVDYCLPKSTTKKVLKSLAIFLRDMSEQLGLGKPFRKKHPVILVIDESLDCFPWEMIDVLQDEPVSRVPSLHFIYSLFKIHQKDIKNGHKVVTDYDKGAYVVNPDGDLESMQTRIINFFNYWLPNWTGTSGYRPSDAEFFELLTSSDIFSYNGHGNGAHLMSTDKIQRTTVKAVVLLFGCGSTKISRMGPQVEAYGSYHMYLIARCPCVVGMLWEVTDIDTDVLTTAFISNWIPSKATTHWKFVDKSKWKSAEQKIEFTKTSAEIDSTISNEPELLRALSLSKKSSAYYGTKAACVARGLPVIIQGST